MSIVYVVTSGEYSDYHIDRVYSDKTEAENYVATHDDPGRYSGEHNIEEWPVGEQAYYEGNIWRGEWTTWYRPKGETHGRSVVGAPGWIDYTDPAVEQCKYNGVHPQAATASLNYYCDDENLTYVGIQITGLDKERVTKALHDRVAEAKARMAGIA